MWRATAHHGVPVAVLARGHASGAGRSSRAASRCATRVAAGRVTTRERRGIRFPRWSDSCWSQRRWRCSARRVLQRRRSTRPAGPRRSWRDRRVTTTLRTHAQPRDARCPTATGMRPCTHRSTLSRAPHDVEADLKDWIQTLVGEGEGTGIPTPQNKIAFLVRRDDTDLALLWYVSDGSGGWLRDSYTACASAVQS